VAGPNGAAIEPGSALYGNLLAALRRASDPAVGVRVASYRPALFRVAGRLLVDPDRVPELVLSAAGERLRAAFSFDGREFGQTVTLGEVVAVLQAVEGVVAVDLDALHRAEDRPSLQARLPAERPLAGSPGAGMVAAELLTLDPSPIPLEVMP
jgi:hypothetical protein